MSDVDSIHSRPLVRGILVCDDVEDDEYSLPRSMEFFMNPDKINFDLQAEWARIAVPGLSHEVLQYSHTKSNELSFELEWDSIEAQRRMKGEQLVREIEGAQDDWSRKIRESSIHRGMYYKEFLYSLLQPVTRGRAPSRVTLIWPGVLHTRGVITNIKFVFTKFGQSGGVMSFRASVEMLELRRVFISRERITEYFERAPVDMVFALAPEEIEQQQPRRRKRNIIEREDPAFYGTAIEFPSGRVS